MPLSVRYEVLLPVRHNDGSLVEEHTHLRCMDEMVDTFGGATMEPQRVFGRWVFGGATYEDQLMRLIVEVDDTVDHHAWFWSWKQTLKVRFHQLDIHMTWHPIHVV